MTYARPRAPRLSTVDLRHVIDEAVAVLRRDPIASTLDIRVEGDGGAIIVDHDLLRAALVNLLLNAAQAMNGQGQVRISSTFRDRRWSVEVCDNGPGIPVDIREQVMEPFFTTKARGGGLGLPIANRVAELHGGALTLTFPAFGGTSVTIAAPIDPAQHAL
jgi:signal transduction histidine kinase